MSNIAIYQNNKIRFHDFTIFYPLKNSKHVAIENAGVTMSRTFPGHAWEEKCAKEKKMHLLQKNVKVLKKQLLDKRQCTSQGFEIVINIHLFDLNSELCIKRPQTCMTGADWSSPGGRALPVLYR